MQKRRDNGAAIQPQQSRPFCLVKEEEMIVDRLGQFVKYVTIQAILAKQPLKGASLLPGCLRGMRDISARGDKQRREVCPFKFSYSTIFRLAQRDDHRRDLMVRKRNVKVFRVKDTGRSR